MVTKEEVDKANADTYAAAKTAIYEAYGAESVLAANAAWDAAYDKYLKLWREYFDESN